MPSAGLQIFGSGLQLQPVTPGVTDQGNANISGTFIARTGIWHLNGAENLGMFGRNPGVNQTLNWGNVVEPNCIFGYNNTIVDGNVIQNSVFVGSNNNIGNAAHVGVTSFLVVGSENTLYTGGDNGNILSAIVIGNNNKCNKTPGTTSNEGPIIVGYNNNWNNINNNTAYDPGVIIGKNINISGGSTFNTTIIGPMNSDAPPTTGNAVKIGNRLQKNVQVGAYNLGANFVKSLFRQTATAVVSNTVAETTIIAAGTGSSTIPADSLNAGSVIKIVARGYLRAATAPNLQLRVYLNSVLHIDFGAIALPAIAGDVAWELNCDLTVRQVGTGAVLGNGFMKIGAATAKIFGSLNVATVAVDETIANPVNVTAQWSAANAQNYIGCTNLDIQVHG